jgi:hypothetical protein
MLGRKWEEATGNWTKWRNWELRYLYFSPSIRMMKPRRIILEGQKGSAYSILMGKYGGKKVLEKICLTWESNIKIDFKETGFEGVYLNCLARDMRKWRAL